MTRPVVTPRPTVYLRTIAGAPPVFSYRNIARFLSGSTWDPMPVKGAVARSPKLRFTIAHPRRRPIDTSVRSVLIRRIERRDGVTLVEVDGDLFALASCGSARRPLACLTLRDDVNLDQHQYGGQGYGGHGYGGGAGFAQPPP